MIKLTEISKQELFKLRLIFNVNPEDKRLSQIDLMHLSQLLFKKKTREEYRKLSKEEQKKYVILDLAQPKYLKPKSESGWTVFKGKLTERELASMPPLL